MSTIRIVVYCQVDETGKIRYYEVDNQGNKYMHAKRFNSDDDARVFIDEIRKSLNLLWYEIDIREED